jgi:mycofactocin precursor
MVTRPHATGVRHEERAMDDPTTELAADQATDDSRDVTEELLVEEVSIDGMCGVY